MDTPDTVTEASVTAPGGWGASLRGKNSAFLQLVSVLTIAGTLFYLIDKHETNSETRSQQNVAALKALTVAVEKTERTQRETTEAVIWVLTKPQAERERLELSRPKLITEMQR